MSSRALIAHVLYRLDTGGMERVLVTLINHTHERYRHAIVCLEGYSDFRNQIQPGDVPCLALNKKAGKDWRFYIRLWRTLRKLQPDLVHTYNIGALDVAPIARMAGARRIIHAERGRSAADPYGESRKYRLLRRWLLPFIDRYLAVSSDLQHWLVDRVGIPASRVVCVPNGIDVSAFTASTHARKTRPLLGSFAPPGTVLIGTVARLDAVKDHAGLITAFADLCETLPAGNENLRLVLVGEGPERAALETQIAKIGLTAQIQLLGNRTDVAGLLAEFDIFALSSVAEGMPGAVLEAMASGLPVVATAVGGVGELVVDQVTGMLVPVRDPEAFTKALADYARQDELRMQHGAAGRERVEASFSLQTTLSAHTALYDRLLDHTQQQRPESVAAGRTTEHEED